MKLFTIIFSTFLLSSVLSCAKQEKTTPEPRPFEWKRSDQNPILRDLIQSESYEVASDPHPFFDENGDLAMIYTADVHGHESIKLARGASMGNWKSTDNLLYLPGPGGRDSGKETAFYRKSLTGKHQIFYIGYPDDDDSYQAEIYLAEAGDLAGPYTQYADPVISRGIIANHDVYCMTSPSIMEHDGQLYISFIGWDASPNEVTEVWVIGATSSDEGRTWENFKDVETRIGMEGQVTKAPDGSFTAVRTGDFEDTEAIFIATADHPFGPWTADELPIIVKSSAGLELHEAIAPALIFDLSSGEKHLFYTGADYAQGWWLMLASEK